MKVLQISTPFLPISHQLNYGGTERIVYLLDRELNKRCLSAGVVAPGDSKPESELHPTIPISIGVEDILDRGNKSKFSGLYSRLEHLGKAFSYINNEIDIVHLHDDNILPFIPYIGKPSLLTLHSDIDGFWGDKNKYIKEINANLVAISQSQKEIYRAKGFNVEHVVYNGVDEDLFEFSENKLNYLLTLGSIQPVKGQSSAIKIAKKSGLDLIIAGNIGAEEYFNKEIRPNITHDLTREENKLESYLSLPTKQHKIVYLGSVNDKQKAPLYSRAKAFLMPIEWEEPFGLVMVEAMMSGTPVIAFDRGSIPEIVKDGTGIIVPAGNLEQMAKAVRESEKIDSEECRRIAITNFGKEQMVDNYIKIYKEVLNNN